MRNERDCLGAGNSADTVLDNTPPITPDSSDGNDSPSRYKFLPIVYVDINFFVSSTVIYFFIH